MLDQHAMAHHQIPNESQGPPPPGGMTPMPGPWGFFASGYAVTLFAMVRDCIKLDAHILIYNLGIAAQSDFPHRSSLSSQSTAVCAPTSAAVILQITLGYNVPYGSLIHCCSHCASHPLSLFCNKIPRHVDYRPRACQSQLPERSMAMGAGASIHRGSHGDGTAVLVNIPIRVRCFICRCFDPWSRRRLDGQCCAVQSGTKADPNP